MGIMSSVDFATPTNERQQRINNFRCCILYNLRAMVPYIPIIKELPAIMGYMLSVDVPPPANERQLSLNWASTERQQSVNRVLTEHQQSVNRVLTGRQQSVNRASTECQQSVNRASTERQQSVNRVSSEHQQSVHGFHYCILNMWRPMQPHLPIIDVLSAVMGNAVSVNIATPEVSITSVSTES